MSQKQNGYNEDEESPIYSEPNDDYEEDDFDDANVSGDLRGGDGVENGEDVMSGDNDDYSEPNAESDLTSQKLKEASKTTDQAEQERLEMEEAELLMEQERERQRKL